MDENNRKRRHQSLIKKQKIFGTRMRPRLTLFRSLKHIYGIFVDDEEGKVITGISSLSPDFTSSDKSVMGGNVKGAERVGSLLGKKALQLGIKKVKFDRSGYSFAGRIKAFIEGAKKSGLNF